MTTIFVVLFILQIFMAGAILFVAQDELIDERGMNKK